MEHSNDITFTASPNPIVLVEVRIGRNIGPARPMAATHWDDFIEEVQDAVRAAFGRHIEWDETHTAEAGTWKGQEEEAAVVTAYCRPAAETDAEGLHALLRDAVRLARGYAQDAVAVVHGGRSYLAHRDGTVER